MLDMADETMLYTVCTEERGPARQVVYVCGQARAVEVGIRNHGRGYPCVSLAQFRAVTRGTQGTDCPLLAGRARYPRQRGRRRCQERK